jgi:GPI-GlcNAc transferase complex, PIG-H component
MTKLPDECLFEGCRFQVDRPNSAVTRFSVKRLRRADRSIWLKWVLPGLLLSAALAKSLFWFGVVAGLWGLLALGGDGAVLEESAEVFSGVALQLSTKFSDGSTKHRMIPLSEISEVVLNEAAAGFYVRTYLAVLPKRIGAKSILPFEHTELPLWLSSKLLFALRTALA